MSISQIGRRSLVAGGAGFVGSHLCERLLSDGGTVFCVDDLSTGAARNIAHLTNNPRFEFIAHDVVEPLQIDVDEVFNLACPASPRHYQSDPIRTMEVNVVGTLNLLNLARRLKAKTVHASTSEVYGDPLVHPQVETDWGNVNPIGPRACYDEGKRAAETLCFDFRRMHGLDVRVARVFNTYGPRMSAGDGRMAPNFIAQALEGAPITVFGDGAQTRSLCYVDDLVRGLIAMMRAEPGRPGPVNLGADRETTVLEVAEMIIRLCNSSSTIVREPLPEDDPKRRRPDISRAREVLGWAPKVSLEDGLAKTIAYFRREAAAAPQPVVETG